MQYDIFPFELGHFDLLKELWEHHLDPVFKAEGVSVFRLEWDLSVTGERLPVPFLPSLRAYAALTAGRYEDALKGYLEAVAIGVAEAGDFTNMAYASVRLGRLKEALPYAERSVKLDPKNAEARINLGELYEALGRRRDALSHLERACVLAPNNEKFRQRLREIRGY
jgi:tetratricopeptide (TPR) repeat protein